MHEGSAVAVADLCYVGLASNVDNADNSDHAVGGRKSLFLLTSSRWPGSCSLRWRVNGLILAGYGPAFYTYPPHCLGQGLGQQLL